IHSSRERRLDHFSILLWFQVNHIPFLFNYPDSKAVDHFYQKAIPSSSLQVSLLSLRNSPNFRVGIQAQPFPLAAKERIKYEVHTSKKFTKFSGIRSELSTSIQRHLHHRHHEVPSCHLRCSRCCCHL